MPDNWYNHMFSLLIDCCASLLSQLCSFFFPVRNARKKRPWRMGILLLSACLTLFTTWFQHCRGYWLLACGLLCHLLLFETDMMNDVKKKMIWPQKSLPIPLPPMTEKREKLCRYAFYLNYELIGDMCSGSYKTPSLYWALYFCTQKLRWWNWTFNCHHFLLTNIETMIIL